MTSETDTEVQTAPLMPAIPLDPSKWEEPKEKFFGRITRCQYSDTDQAKSRDGQTFTEMRNWPKAGATWEVAIERHDAIYRLPDGSTAPVVRYMTIDLQRLDEKNHRLVGISAGDNKATFTLNQWAKGGVRLAPDPGRAVGLDCEFEFLRSKMFRGNAAKNIVYPLKILPKGWVYNGEVTEFEVKEQQVGLDEVGEQASGGANGAPVTASQSQSAPAVAMTDAELAAALDGMGVDDEAALMTFINENKSKLTAGQRMGLVQGTAQSALDDAGLLGIEAGTYVAKEAKESTEAAV